MTLPVLETLLLQNTRTEPDSNGPCGTVPFIN